MNRKRLSIFIVLSFSGLFNGSTIAGDVGFPTTKVRTKPKSFFNLKQNTKLIVKRDVVDLLRQFVRHSRPSRMVGSDGHAKASEYLLEKIRELDTDLRNLVTIEEFRPDIKHAKSVYKKDFSKATLGKFESTHPFYKKLLAYTESMTKALDKRKEVMGKNIVWEKKGSVSPSEVIIIAAHYDTRANNSETLLLEEDVQMPGADGNASGVAIGLALIQILSKMELPKTVRVVFFDWEEFNFLGSKAYVDAHLNELKKKKFTGFINLKMLGHDSKLKDKEGRYGNMKLYIRKPSESGHDKDKKLAERLVSMGKKAETSIKFDIVDNSFRGPDDSNFWNKELPGVIFTQNWESDFNQSGHHSPNDFVETVNTRTLYRSYTFIAGAIGAVVFNFLP